MAARRITANKNSWESFNGPWMLCIHMKDIYHAKMQMSNVPCSMYWLSSAHTLNFCTNLLYTAFCILSRLIKNQRSTDLWPSQWQKPQRQLFKRKKINGRKWSELEKPKLPTPRTFGESRKGSWVLPPIHGVRSPVNFMWQILNQNAISADQLYY